MKTIRLLLLLLLDVGATELRAQNSLTVTLTDGTQRVFKLSERPELLWEGDNIIISTATTEMSVPRKNFKGLNVSDALAIEAVKNVGSRVTIGANGLLNAEGLKAGSTIKVYDAAGRQINQQKIAPNGRVTVNLSKQPAGTYFVKIDHQQTLKIVRP